MTMLSANSTTDGTTGSTQYDFSKSNLVLLVGGQILILVILLLIVFFGVPPMSFPANSVRNLVSTIKNIRNEK